LKVFSKGIDLVESFKKSYEGPFNFNYKKKYLRNYPKNKNNMRKFHWCSSLKGEKRAKSEIFFLPTFSFRLRKLYE
tara:strand:+ start:501 stop:728 length:228 start_codon:yes stop_codon:yes gene_type:complete